MRFAPGTGARAIARAGTSAIALADVLRTEALSGGEFSLLKQAKLGGGIWGRAHCPK